MSNYFTSGQKEEAYIQQRAAVFGLDPRAVLAVAAHEGITLPAKVGDQGTSFGPWQMHAGGRLPDSIWGQGPQAAQQWANSPSGIDAALQGIKGAVGNATGATAIALQVQNYEQPQANLVAGEISASIQSYNSGSGPTLLNGLPPVGGGTGSTSPSGGNPLPPAGGGGAQNVSFLSGLGSDVSGSIQEAFLRAGELFVALVLFWVAIKSLNGFFGRYTGPAIIAGGNLASLRA